MELKYIKENDLIIKDFELPSIFIEKIVQTDINSWKKIIFDNMAEIKILCDGFNLNPKNQAKSISSNSESLKKSFTINSKNKMLTADLKIE